MAAPAGTKTNRWNLAVKRVSQDTGWSDVQSDAWLNDVWNNMYTGDEIRGQITAHQKLLRWLEVNYPDAGTLPSAFRLAVS